ncbi:MAG: 50S ribosomal protein L4 [Candidatus Binatia bacterium]
MELPVLDSANSEVARVVLPELFSGAVKDYLMFEQVLAQRASGRAGTASTKTRGLIRGGGAKPWRQKGTGRARAGSRRSPIWRGGGTIFGPQPRSYAFRLPRSARKAALRSALAQKARDGQIRVLDKLDFDAPKTKQMRTLLQELGIRRPVLVVIPARDAAVELSARNLPGVKVTVAEGLNVYDLIGHEWLLLVRDSLGTIEERLS